MYRVLQFRDLKPERTEEGLSVFNMNELSVHHSEVGRET